MGTVDLPGRGWGHLGLSRASAHRPPSGCSARQAYPDASSLVAGAGLRRPTSAIPYGARTFRPSIAFLLSVRGRTPVPAPARERSLQIFGDEKRLDDLRKGEPSLFEGRVPLADLHCYPVAPPLPHETPPKQMPGRPILVLENYHSWDSFRRWNREAALYAAIAYGGGNAFRQGRGQPRRPGRRRAGGGVPCTLGDLDPAGARILIGGQPAAAVRGAGGAAAPSRPLRVAARARAAGVPWSARPENAEIDGLGDVFPADLARALAELWSEGQAHSRRRVSAWSSSRGVEAEFAAPGTG